MDGEHPEKPEQRQPKGDRQQVEPRARWVEQRPANEQSETARHGQQTVLETETTTYGQAGWTWREMATKTEESDGDARRRPNKRLDKAKKNDDGDKDKDGQLRIGNTDGNGQQPQW